MLTAELVVTLVALAAFLLAAIRMAWRSRTGLRREHCGAAVLFLFLGWVRWELTTPMFVHASLHGAALLNAPYENPFTSIRNYGPFGILIQGSVMHLLRADLTTVAMVNQAFAVLTLAVMACVARHWTGSRTASLYVLAAAAFHPVLMRQGSSEDGHSLAVLLAWLAIAAIEEYSRRGRWEALVACASLSALMVETRQGRPIPCAIFSRQPSAT